MKGLSVPDGSFVNRKGRVVAVNGDGVGGVGLELYGVRAGFARRMDKF